MSGTPKPAVAAKYRPRRKPRAPLPVVYIEAAGTTTLAELVARVNVPSPDAQLVAACDRLLYLREQRHELYRLAEPGYMKPVRTTLEEQDRLEAEIDRTVPTTCRAQGEGRGRHIAAWRRDVRQRRQGCPAGLHAGRWGYGMSAVPKPVPARCSRTQAQ